MESGVLWCSKVLELSLLPLTFGPSLTRASRHLHSHSTKNKIPKIMMKQFSTARNTQRDPQSYIKKIRGRIELEVTRRRKWSESCSVMSESLQPHELYSPWNFQARMLKYSEVGNLFFLQGIFSTQGSNPGLLLCGWILYKVSHKGSNKIMVIF